MEASKPDEFVWRAVPLSEGQAKTRTPEVYSRRIAAAALLSYFKEFIDGRYRNLLEAMAPYVTGTFTTSFSQSSAGTARVNPMAEGQDAYYNREGELSLGAITSPRRVQDQKTLLQLARKSLEYDMKLPCLIVSDTGTQFAPSGLDFYDRTYIDQDQRKAFRVKSRTQQIPFDLVIGGKNEDQCAELVEATSLMLDQRGRVGSEIRGQNWRIVLPLSHSESVRSTQNVLDNPTHSFSFASISLEIFWESHQTDEIQMHGQGYPCIPTFDPDTRGEEILDGKRPPIMSFTSLDALPKPQAHIPTHVSLRDKPKISLQRYPTGTLVYSNNHRVAIVDENRRIFPRAPGIFSVIIKNGRSGKVEKFKVQIIGGP